MRLVAWRRARRGRRRGRLGASSHEQCCADEHQELLHRASAEFCVVTHEPCSPAAANTLVSRYWVARNLATWCIVYAGPTGKSPTTWHVQDAKLRRDERPESASSPTSPTTSRSRANGALSSSYA